jgi:peptide methionine sulfoxide reductase MsrA
MTDQNTKYATFGAGCFWQVEQEFREYDPDEIDQCYLEKRQTAGGSLSQPLGR